MGYIINEDIIKNPDKDIAEPATISLAANSNFLQFAQIGGKITGSQFKKTYMVNRTNTISKVEISLTKEIDREKLVFTGTTEPKMLNRTTFLIHAQQAVTAENLRRCMLNEPFLRNNYDINLNLAEENGKIVPGNTITITAKKRGNEFALSLTCDKNFISESISRKPGIENVTTADCDIEVEVYTDTGIKPGQSSAIVPGKPLGTYATTFSKTYWGEPLWFDVNVLSRGITGYSDNFLTENEWCDAGTVTDFRLSAAQVKNGERRTFYISDVLYALNGYAPTLDSKTLDKKALDGYVYNTGSKDICTPLSTRLHFTHVRGQVHFFNFILSDTVQDAPEDKIGILYKAFSQSGKEIAIDTPVMHEAAVNGLSIVNTIKLCLDTIIAGNDKIGIVKAYLCHNGKAASEPMVFTILPHYMYEIKDFAFLNRLGGWSSFSFGAQSQTEFKSSADVVYATLTPRHKVRSPIETVHRRDLSEQFTVQTMPITRDMAEWLKEMSASTAVYEYRAEDSKYVIIDELAIKHNTTDDLFRIEMKYHYSDSYNAQIVKK